MSHVSSKPEQSTTAEAAVLTALANLTPGGAGTAIEKTGAVSFSNVPLSAAGGFQQPISGTVNGINKTFVWATAPNAIVVDQAGTKQKNNSAPDLTANWTGTTTTILSVAPTFDIFAVA